MSNNKLVRDEFNTDVNFLKTVPTLVKAKTKFGEIKTYFQGYKNPIGIEIEIENLAFPEENLLYWQSVEDNSLKIRGIEFISIPLLGRNIDYAMLEIKPYITKSTNLWSHRTSIHVHQNVNDLSINQLETLIALYASMEDLFFHLVDPIRRSNPYCYHLTDTAPDKSDLGENSNKYCALNFGECLKTQGTIEYRHMHGTGDMKQIRRWIQLISKIHLAVLKHGSEKIRKRIMALSYTSQYLEFLEEILGATATLFTALNHEKLMADCVGWAKMYLLLGEQR